MPAERSKYETHHGWAVNVKDQVLYSADPDDLLGYERVQGIYEMHTEDFWRDAEIVAQSRGFQRVYSEGRMGGWLVVDPQPVDYLDGLDYYNFDRKMGALDRELHALMDYHREAFLESVAEAIRLETAEPVERAYWEARDVETVGCS